MLTIPPEIALLFGWLGFGFCCAYLLLLSLRVTSSLSWAHHLKRLEKSAEPEQLTIMQPILSGDPLLKSSLASVAESAPDWVQLLWLIDADDPEAATITHELKLTHADTPIRILSCPPVEASRNPKTVKLELGLAEITTPLFCVLDDDSSPGALSSGGHNAAKTLAIASARMREVDLYTGLPIYQASGFYAGLVKAFVNTNAVLTYLALTRWTGPLSINGMFYVMRTQWIKDHGSFKAIETQLCDDYALARHVMHHGGRIEQGIAPVTVETTVPDADQYFRLMHRWFVFAEVLLNDQSRRIRYLLYMTLGLPPLLLYGFILCLLLGAWPWLILPFLLTRALLTFVLASIMKRPWTPAVSLISTLTELLQPMHWLHSRMSRVIRWRTRRIKVHVDGGFEYLNPDQTTRHKKKQAKSTLECTQTGDRP